MVSRALFWGRVSFQTERRRRAVEWSGSIVASAVSFITHITVCANNESCQMALILRYVGANHRGNAVILGISSHDDWLLHLVHLGSSGGCGVMFSA